MPLQDTKLHNVNQHEELYRNITKHDVILVGGLNLPPHFILNRHPN